MRYLLDTHILLWSALAPGKLSSKASALLVSGDHSFYFSSASIWEVAIKHRKFPDTFLVHPRLLCDALLELGYREVGITSNHAVQTARLPLFHKDPFDRLIVAQAIVEDLVLLTVDAEIVLYNAPVLDVR